jgi:hypothetical protein
MANLWEWRPAAGNPWHSSRSTGSLFQLTGHPSIRHSVEKGDLCNFTVSCISLPHTVVKLPPENEE